MHAKLSRKVVTTSVLKRLWSRIPITGDDDCWEWEGSRTPRGYGRIGVTDSDTGKHFVEYAHRLVFVAANGVDIPLDMVVMHSCDNPPCCNPSHLSLGTQADNMRDRDVKMGRQSRPSDYVERVIAMYGDGQTVREIARAFGVAPSGVHSLLQRRGVRLRSNRQQSC